jgi:hypothetical protein
MNTVDLDKAVQEGFLLSFVRKCPGCMGEGSYQKIAPYSANAAGTGFQTYGAPPIQLEREQCAHCMQGFQFLVAAQDEVLDWLLKAAFRRILEDEGARTLFLEAYCAATEKTMEGSG